MNLSDQRVGACEAATTERERERDGACEACKRRNVKVCEGRKYNRCEQGWQAVKGKKKLCEWSEWEHARQAGMMESVCRVCATGQAVKEDALRVKSVGIARQESSEGKVCETGKR